ncbi:hypothetical protein ABVN80_05185 [Acinetobacter baumannii]
MALVAVGSREPESWHAKPQPMDFFDFKGEVGRDLSCWTVKAEYVRSERPWLHPGQSAEILVDGQSLVIGPLASIFRKRTRFEHNLGCRALIRLLFCNLMYLILQNYHVFLRLDVILRFNL